MNASHIDYDSVAELYDLYVTASYDFGFFQAEAAKADGPVLELTAGTGRLSLPLLEAGVTLTCVDVACGMLELLARKARARGLAFETLCTDLCDLALPPSFALAILPFQAFMEIVGEERQRRALAAVHSALLPGGRFICTVHNPAVRRKMVDGALRVVGRFPAPEGSLVVSGFEQGGFPVVQRLQFFEIFGPGGELLWKRMLAMEFAFVEKEVFDEMARDAGFRVAALYGDYDRSPFDPVSSPVMIWVLEKAEA